MYDYYKWNLELEESTVLIGNVPTLDENNTSLVFTSEIYKNISWPLLVAH
jgi:hypothetical protein